jgi:hypothetical protein
MRVRPPVLFFLFKRVPLKQLAHSDISARTPAELRNVGVHDQAVLVIDHDLTVVARMRALPPVPGSLRHRDFGAPALRFFRGVSEEAPALPVRQRSNTARTRSSCSATSVYSSRPVWCSTL